MDANFLASSKVGTPDPRKEHPPEGQRLIVAWDFPKSLFLQNLRMIATVRFWDHREQIVTCLLERKRDTAAFFFPNKGLSEKGKILTYLVQIVSDSGEVIETWEHPFWTEPRYNFSSAARISDSVSSQPMQASVIDTP